MGIFAKIKKAWFDTIVWETIDDDFYDELEESLILADLGATVAHDAVKKLRDVVYQKSIQRGDDVKQALREILIEKLNVGDTALDLSTKPSGDDDRLTQRMKKACEIMRLHFLEIGRASCRERV